MLAISNIDFIFTQRQFTEYLNDLMKRSFITFLLVGLLAISCNMKEAMKKAKDRQLAREQTEETIDFYSDNVRFVDGLVSPKEFNRMLQDCDTALVLDARPAESFRGEPYIKNAIPTFNRQVLNDTLRKLHPDHLIMVYCGQEVYSPYMVKRLIQKGFNNVYEMQGGLIYWKKLLLPLVDENGKPYQYTKTQ